MQRIIFDVFFFCFFFFPFTFFFCLFRLLFSPCLHALLRPPPISTLLLYLPFQFNVQFCNNSRQKSQNRFVLLNVTSYKNRTMGCVITIFMKINQSFYSSVPRKSNCKRNLWNLFCVGSPRHSMFYFIFYFSSFYLSFN